MIDSWYDVREQRVHIFKFEVLVTFRVDYYDIVMFPKFFYIFTRPIGAV